MKEGISLQEMAAEITRQNQLKEDYLVDTRSLKLEPSGGQLYLHMYDKDVEVLEPFEVNSIAHRQVGSYLKIPADYYDRMRNDYPELLAENVNSWFNREPAKRMLRTIGSTARAFLSNRYRRIDNMEIAKVVLPIIGQMEGAHFESCQITESRMYMKIVNTALKQRLSPAILSRPG